MKSKQIRHLRDLTPDNRNANRGTERGDTFIERSLRQYGAGRSILIDKNGMIIAGNKTVENAGAIGLNDVVVVQTDGTKVVAVQRVDLDMKNDPKARELALADNRAAELNLEWAGDVLVGLAKELDLGPFFTAAELAALVEKDAKYSAVPEPKLDQAEELKKKRKTDAEKTQVLVAV